MKDRFFKVMVFVFFFCSSFAPTLVFGEIPTIAISPLLISDSITNDQIRNFIDRWRQSWQAKRLDDYINCYAANFQHGRKDLQAWRKHKENLNRKYKTITVEVDDLKINLKENEAKVLFHQVYRSDKYFDKGLKLLVLTYSDKNGWQILRESSIN